MTRLLQFSFVTRLIEKVAFKLALASSGWLQENAGHKWRTVMRIRENKGAPRNFERIRQGQRYPSVNLVPQKQDIEKTFESGVSRSIQDDMQRLTSATVSLPRWAREVAPFLANQLSDHTRRAYETDLKQFFRFMEGRISVDDITQLKAEHVIIFRKGLQEGRVTGRPMAQATVNRKLAVVKSFLNWLRANQVVTENPAQWVKGFPQSQESSLQGLSDEEAAKVMRLPNTNSKAGALHQAILTVLFFMGLRKGELIGLKMGDIDKVRGVDVLKVRGKGHKVRVIPLTQKVKNAIEHYFWACSRKTSDKDAPMFIPTKNPRTGVTEKPLNPNAITYIVAKYAKKAGILKPISPHSCRATCISNALDRKATHRSVQHLAGWSTPLMIQRYDKRREDLKNSAAFSIDYDTAEAG